MSHSAVVGIRRVVDGAPRKCHLGVWGRLLLGGALRRQRSPRRISPPRSGFYILPGVQPWLEPGMIATVEPGVYGQELVGGSRIEVNVLVTETGYEILSPAPRTLI